METAKIFVEHFECVCYGVKPFINMTSCNLLNHCMCCYPNYIEKLRLRKFTKSSPEVVWQWIQETISDSLIAELRLLSYY